MKIPVILTVMVIVNFTSLLVYALSEFHAETLRTSLPPVRTLSGNQQTNAGVACNSSRVKFCSNASETNGTAAKESIDAKQPLEPVGAFKETLDPKTPLDPIAEFHEAIDPGSRPLLPNTEFFQRAAPTGILSTPNLRNLASPLVSPESRP